MNEIKILFFATLKDLAGMTETTLALPEDAQVSVLKTTLGEKFPNLIPALGSVVVSVNREFAFDEEEIPPDAEVALFPPVSGGNGKQFPTVCVITEEEVNLNATLAGITLPTTGAAGFFTGMVRGMTRRGDPHETTRLEYEAYQPMAEAKMQQVAEEIRQRWPDIEGIAIIQRVGTLHPGTPTVMIACTAPHRDQGVFEAARYGIDRLKEIVPIWKKEVGVDGEVWVEGEYLPTKGD